MNLNWLYLSSNKNAITLLEKNQDRIHWLRYTHNRGPWEFLAVSYCPSWNNIRAVQVEKDNHNLLLFIQ